MLNSGEDAGIKSVIGFIELIDANTTLFEFKTSLYVFLLFKIEMKSLSDSSQGGGLKLLLIAFKLLLIGPSPTQHFGLEIKAIGLNDFLDFLLFSSLNKLMF